MNLRPLGPQPSALPDCATPRWGPRILTDRRERWPATRIAIRTSARIAGTGILSSLPAVKSCQLPVARKAMLPAGDLGHDADEDRVRSKGREQRDPQPGDRDVANREALPRRGRAY